MESADFLKIFDGPSMKFPVLGNYYGEPSHNTDPLNSTGRSLFIQFKSDGSRSGGTFSFEFWVDHCLPSSEYNNPTGLLTDGTSPYGRYRNSSCKAEIRPKKAVDQVNFYFEHLNLYPNDNVTITTLDGMEIYTARGSGPVPPIYAPEGAVVNFQSKVNISQQTLDPHGYHLRYTAGYCTPTAFIDLEKFEISDGSGNQNYADNVYCEWLFEPKSHSDVLTFYAVTLATAESSDYITVYDGPSAAFPKLKVLSGKVLMDPVYTSGESMLVTWKTDGSRNDMGFVAHVIAGSCLSQVTFTSQQNYFTDGSGSNLITNDVCAWQLIPTKPDQMITVYIGNVSLASGVLQVFAGPNTLGNIVDSIQNSPNPFLNAAHPPIEITGPSATLLMKGAEGGEGFSVSYSSGRCLNNQIVNFWGATGSFSDGSGPANYMDSTKCGWVIRPQGNSTTVSITVTGNTAESSDKLSIYDGTDATFPLIVALSGNFQTSTVESTTESLFVFWSTDGSTNSAGWSAKYTGKW